MRKIFLLSLFTPFFVFAQTPQVPSRMEFAGLTLKITEAARRDIQADRGVGIEETRGSVQVGREKVEMGQDELEGGVS